MKTLAPIALFCYNRLDVLKETVEALKKNILAPESELFIFSDGAKKGQEEKVQNVRDYIKKIQGFKSVNIIESQTNKGLANSLISGITEIINKYNKIIVIEDDILTSPYFLNYINDALDFYENEQDVGSITGFCYPFKEEEKLNQTYFVKGFECWSWATWKRSWDLFEPDCKKLMDELERQNLVEEFNYDNSHICYDMLLDHLEGRVNTWALRFQASLFLKGKLCLYPNKPLAKNIGFSISGTHTKGRNKGSVVELNKEPFKLEKIEVKQDNLAWKYMCQYFKKHSGRIKGNFLYKRERIGHKRIITILGIFKFSYLKK